MRFVDKAVGTVGKGKKEHREPRESGDEALNGTKYVWRYNRQNVPERRRVEFAAVRRSRHMEDNHE